MRLRPLATLSIAAAAVLLLAGCSGSSTASGTSSATPSASPTDLCSAGVASGAASDAVTVGGTVGVDATATFTSPLTIDKLQRTVVTQGTGTPLKSGDLVNYALTAFNADTGAKLGTEGYNPGEVLPLQVAASNALGQLLGCANPGTRIVATLPSSTSNGTTTPGEIYVLDFLGVVPSVAWGAAQPPVDGFPTVTLDSSGAPSVTIADGLAMPTAFQKETLKKGDGATVATGDKVLVQYYGYSWDKKKVFDQSWGKQTFSFTAGTGVVQGFTDAVVGETVGSQVVAVLPPASAYGDGTINDTDLKGQTLVFVVDILGVQHPTTTGQ